MADLWADVWNDVWGGTAPGGPTFVNDRPRVIVQVGAGSPATSDPTSGAFVLGKSRLGTGILTSFAWVDLEGPLDQLVSVDIPPANQDELSSANPGTATVVVENYSGNWDPDNAASPYAGLLDVGMPVRILAQLQTDVGTVRYGLFGGNVDDIVPDYGTDPTVTFSCTDLLASLGRVKVAPLAVDGDLTGVRIGHILDAAQVPASKRALDRGLSTCQPTTEADWALQLAQQVVDTEVGELWADGDGVVRFYDRTRVYITARSTTVQATFSDSGTDVDMTGLAAGRRRADIFNEARITRQGDTAVEQVATNAASQARYGPQTYPSTAGTLLRSDTDAQSLAHWILARFANPRTRFSSIAVDATTQGMWSALMPLRRFDRIRTIRDYGPHTVDRQLLIEGIGHTITKDAWGMTIATRDVDNVQPFVLGVSRLGTGVLV